MRAMRFGIGIKRPGYNIFALGGPGTAKHAMVREFLDRVAAERAGAAGSLLRVQLRRPA